jgi:hypothetical protein
LRFSGGITTYEAGEQVPAMFTPRISAVRGPQIAARNFIEDQTGVGTTPTLAWTAPTTGTVTQLPRAHQLASPPTGDRP